MAVPFIAGALIGGLFVGAIFFFAGRSVYNENENLENQLRKKDNTIGELEWDINQLEKKIEEIQKCLENVPEGCSPGVWCKACEFKRPFYLYRYNRHGVDYREVVYACGKSEACKNFIQESMPELKGEK